MNDRGMRLRALRAAFPHTIPILTGFLFLGMAYGIYMNVSGFSFLYPLLISLIVFGGSLQFVAVTLLTASFAPLQTILVALLIQARHLFYGFSMLDRLKGLGWKKYYIVFGLCDETFSVICSAEPPEGVDRGWFMFFVALLDHIYWVAGSAIGGLLGSLMTFNTEGLDFVMTAMFVVIFVEQWLKDKRHYTALIGLGAAAACLVFFGADSFLIPTMGVIILLLTLLRKPVEREGGLA